MKGIDMSYRSCRALGAATVIAALTLGGCAGQQGVRYTDPARTETLTTDWGRTDIQMVAERMVNSLVRHPLIANGQRPVVQVSTLRNKTHEHIDTKLITDKIRTALIKTGMVRFSAVSDANREILENLDYQSNSGVVDPRTAKSIGKQIGADYLLQGEIGSIVKQAGRASDVYYNITLNLLDVETGIIEWSDEEEITKENMRSFVGL
jgi:penicillin-binding protein activator